METQQVSKLKKVGLACLLACVAATVSANDRDKAKRIHDRIAGVPPSARRRWMPWRALVAGGNALGAANIATQNASFYNVTLKNMAVPWTNRDQTVFAPLNDYVATFIGMVRDDVAVQHGALCRPDVHRERCDAGGVRVEQRSLRQRRDQRGQPDHRAAADDAVVDARASRRRPPRAS